MSYALAEARDTPGSDPASDLSPGEGPMRIVARGLAPGPLPLGLDRPLELLGGGGLAPDGLVGRLPLDWLPGVVATVADACRRQAEAGRRWLSMRPMALLGPDPTMGVHVARTIARFAGLPFVAMDASDGLVSAGPPRFPDVAFPAPPVLAMAATRCANPVVLATGLDDASETSLGRLAAMIDPVTAERHVEPGLRAVMDLSQVNWIVAAKSDLRFPPTLDASVVRIALPSATTTPDDRRLMVASVLAEAVADLGGPPIATSAGASRVLALVERIAGSGRACGDLVGVRAQLVEELVRWVPV